MASLIFESIVALFRNSESKESTKKDEKVYYLRALRPTGEHKEKA
jgi:hypothetical protein